MKRSATAARWRGGSAATALQIVPSSARRAALVRHVDLGDRARAAPAPQMVDRLVVRDRQQPRPRRGVRAQPRVGAQRGEEGLLEAVLGRLGADHRSQRAPDVVAVSVEQDLEGGEASGASTMNARAQRRIVRSRRLAIAAWRGSC